jgi:hypothetical protein
MRVNRNQNEIENVAAVTAKLTHHNVEGQEFSLVDQFQTCQLTNWREIKAKAQKPLFPVPETPEVVT